MAIKLIIVLMSIIVGGWMVFDGVRALAVGNYITPTTGKYAGQLGPWATLVQKMGIAPQSSFMKLWMASQGGLWILVSLLFLKMPGMWGASVAMAFLGLWYLPFGTVVGLIELILLFLPSMRVEVV